MLHARAALDLKQSMVQVCDRYIYQECGFLQTFVTWRLGKFRNWPTSSLAGSSLTA